MTKREQIDEKHRELFGKKGRKDYSDEKLIAKIEKHTGEKFVIQEEKKEEVKEQPVEAATTDVVEKAPVVKKTPPSSPALHGEETDELGNILKQGRTHLIYINGSPRYFTKNVLEAAIKQYGSGAVLPKNTKYQPNAMNSKCIDC